MIVSQIKDWVPGQEILPAADINSAFDVVKRADRMMGMQPPALATFVPSFIGAVLTAPWGGDTGLETDFIDCRYYVLVLRLLDGSSNPYYPTCFVPQLITEQVNPVIVATNLAELQYNSHNLSGSRLATFASQPFQSPPVIAEIRDTSYGNTALNLDKLGRFSPVLVYAEMNSAGIPRYFFDRTPPQRFVKIISSTTTSNPYIFQYSGTEQFFGASLGFDPIGAAASIPNASPAQGISGRITPLFNLVEWNNAAAHGVHGNSVDDSVSGSYPPNFRMQAVRGNPIKPFWMVGPAHNVQGQNMPGLGTNGRVFLFEYENADDGTCP